MSFFKTYFLHFICNIFAFCAQHYNWFDCLNLSITLCISLFIAHKIVGVGIGTVIAVVGVGRVIALFHHIFESKIEYLIFD